VEILRDQVLVSPAGLFKALSRPNVEALLAALPERHSTFVWNVHTASVLLSSVWLSTQPETAPVTIPLPDGVKGTA
jgi:hypothetical protein